MHSTYLDDSHVSTPVFKGKHEFRSLESLDLSLGLSLGLSLELPRLGTLFLAVYSHSDLTMALSNCPALQSLRIIARFEPDIPWDAALVTRLSTIRDVCVDYRVHMRCGLRRPACPRPVNEYASSTRATCRLAPR